MHHASVAALYPGWVVRIISKLDFYSASSIWIPFLSLFSGVCFGLAWCSHWIGWLLFIVIVPLLSMFSLPRSNLTRGSCSTSKRFCYLVVSLWLWNSLTIWWIYKAAWLAFFFVALYSTLCLSLPWIFYHYMRKWGGRCIGYIGLIASWLTLEYLHLSCEAWELSFPWLNLGNGLAAMVPWIQWYEYTGVLGGSFWILLINICIYHLLFETPSAWLCKCIGGLIVLPLVASILRYSTYREKGIAVEAVFVQPNFDSYTEKCYGTSCFVPYPEQIGRLLTLSKEQLTSEVTLLVWPETAIACCLDEALLSRYIVMQPILNFLKAYPQLSLVTGGSSFCNYGHRQATRTARWKDDRYIDYFNSIFHIRSGQEIEIYHKDKRLPGAEYIPFFYLLPASILNWVKQKMADIGDIDPCLGEGNGPKVFEITPILKVAPINCYESLYGAFSGEAVQKGAMLFTVITNDNWWGNTSVYHQHFQYARLLAIAHRRSLVRSANTGISGAIGQRGDIIAATDRLTSVAKQAMVYAYDQPTFYSLHGDYIGFIASLVCLVLFIGTLGWRLYDKKNAGCATLCRS